MFQLVASIFFLLFTFSNAQNVEDGEGECKFAPLQNLSEYHVFRSILRMPYAYYPLSDDSKLGWKQNVYGINTNGTIYGLGGWYYFRGNRMINRHFAKTNIYNSWISFDDTIAQEWGEEVQNSWLWSNGPVMPQITKPEGVEYKTTYTISEGGFYCTQQCSTYVGDILYIINAVFSDGNYEQANWPKMVAFNMSLEDYMIPDTDYVDDLPYNAYGAEGADILEINYSAPFDKTRLKGVGCTTNNITHIFHFNFNINNNFNVSEFNIKGLSDFQSYFYQSTFAYNIELNEWSLLSGNPEKDKYSFGCSTDISGRYIYLFGGINTGERLLTTTTPQLATDKYDTWTDEWQRLPLTANYPEIYGRIYPTAITDKTSNQIILFGGKSFDQFAPGDPWISAQKIEVFQLKDETWIINQDITNDLYLPDESDNIAVVKAENFKPLGQVSNHSADTVFVFGGGDMELGNNKISFVSILTEREYYDDNTVVIQGNNEFLYEHGTYDSHQRFELGFRVVFPVGIPDEELFNDNWDISFLIDGKDIDSINQQYNTQIMARKGCRDQCKCLNLPSNVKQVVVAQLLIPSQRTLNNGYCVDYDQDWIFQPDSNSTITVLVSNATRAVVHEQDFAFKFAKIELMDETEADLYNIERGCFVSHESDGVLSKFEIRCDGYSCNGCEEELSIGRTDGRPPFVLEYNVLMNDVLLAPDAYILQHNDDQSIVGTQSLSKDSLIALIRAKTKLGTWYEECFHHFFFNFTQKWDTLDQVLTDKSADILYDEVINSLNSGNNEDVVAAYSILKTMINDNEIPEDKDPVIEITNALTMLINKDSNTSIDDITSNVALVNLLTSDTDLVDPNIALEISREWLPDVLNKTIQILNDVSSDTDPGALADTVQKIGGIANSAATNLLKTVNSSSNFSDTEKNQIIEDIQGMMEKELTGTWIGEEIVHHRSGAVTTGKIIITGSKCEDRSGLLSITIPPNNAATNSDTIKCIITITDDDDNAIDLFDSSGTKVFTTNDSCLPYFISMNIPSHLIENDVFELALAGEWYNASGIEYPSCIFWDNINNEWDGRGCVVYSFDSNSIICACTHLTTFRVSGESFNPQAQLLSPSDFNILNESNISSHPTTWVTMLMIVVVLVVACICVPNNNADKPIIAFEDIIYKEFRDQYLHKHQQWHEIQQIDRWYSKIAQTKREMSISGQGHDEYSHNEYVNGSPLFSQMETPTISSPSSPSKSSVKIRKKRKQGKYYCLLSVNLFKTYLKNDHTVLSVFQRTDGTNFSTKQRIGLFLLYMYCIMMADAIFYGNQAQRRPMGELTASALISLIGTCPVYLIRTLFQWSKPRIVKSAKTRNGSINTVNSTINSNVESDEEEEQQQQEQQEQEEEKSYDSEQEMKDEEYLKKTGQIHDTNTKKRLSNTYWSAIAELKKTSRPDMRLVRKCMHYVNTKANASEKASLASEIRLILFNYNYPFPHWYKKMAWTILTLMCLLCVVLSVIYGIQFDIKAAKQAAAIKNNENVISELENIENNNGECWNISHQLVAKHEVYNKQILDIQQEQIRLNTLDEPYNDDISGDIYDSTKWLLNVLISFLTSVFVWQPLSIYLLTWIKIWAFHNGLIMEASVYNLWMFLCCCCTKNKKKKSNKNTTMLEKTIVHQQITQIHGKKQKQSFVPEHSEMYELSVSGSGFAAVGNEDRALDVIGFLCNDELFVDLPDDFESSYTR